MQFIMINEEKYNDWRGIFLRTGNINTDSNGNIIKNDSTSPEQNATNRCNNGPKMRSTSNMVVVQNAMVANWHSANNNIQKFKLKKKVQKIPE